MWKSFLIGQYRSTKQRSGMISEVQSQIFGVWARRMCVKVLIVLIPKGPKFQIRKTVFLVFKENPPKEMFLHLSALIQLLKQ